MPSNTIDLEFGDGVYWFALPLAQIAELQRKTGTGIGALYARTTKGCVLEGDKWLLNPGNAEFFALDLVETIRHGLIGGGKGIVNGEEVAVTPLLANKLVDAYVMGQPFVEAWKIAATVLGVCVLGYEPPKKAAPPKEGGKPKRTPKAASTTARRAPTA